MLSFTFFLMFLLFLCYDTYLVHPFIFIDDTKFVLFFVFASFLPYLRQIKSVVCSFINNTFDTSRTNTADNY